MNIKNPPATMTNKQLFLTTAGIMPVSIYLWVTQTKIMLILLLISIAVLMYLALRKRNPLRPVKTEYTNVTHAENQEDYLPLPVHKQPNDPSGRVTTTWRLGLWERLQTLAWGRVHITLMTFNQPLQPIYVTTYCHLHENYLPQNQIVINRGDYEVLTEIKIGQKIEAPKLGPVTVEGYAGLDELVVSIEQGGRVFRVKKDQCLYDINDVKANTIESRFVGSKADLN